MDYLREKQVFKRRLYSRTAKIILLIIIALLIRPTWNIYKKSRESAENLERAKKELAELEKRQGELSRELENLESEEGIDQEIREKFGVAKAGETVVILVEDKNTPSPATTTPSGGFKLFWSKILEWFNIK